MEINSTPYSPKTLVENNIRFRIPLYQRPYTWTEKQVKQLLDDLWSSSEQSKDSPYFIGIMNISQTDYDDSTFDLIDGQQRLTTLSVMALVMKKCYGEWSKFCGRIDFYGREEDKAFLENGLPKDNTNKNLINAQSVVKSFINSIKDDENNKNKKEFSQYVFEQASFFLSVIPQDYTIIEKNKQFIRMNNRGKQLELVDILKVKLSSVKGVDSKEFLRKWNTISQMNCDEKSDENNQQGELPPTILNIIERYESVNLPKESEIYYKSIVSFDEFLLIALRRVKKDIAISQDKEKILKTFGFDGNEDNKIVWDENSVNNFMCVLEDQFELFREYFIRRDKEEKYKWQNVKSEQAKSNNQNDERNNKEWNMLRQFQSYLYVSREPHQWMKSAFDWLDNNVFKPSVFLEELKRIDNNYATKLLDEGRTYHEKFPNINRYWFWRLDYYLWEKSLHKGSKNRANEDVDNSGTVGIFNLKEEEKRVVEKYEFSSNRSVEHLHPQNESVEGSWDDDDAVNSFGNLAMISQTLNSYQSNKSIQEKFGKIEKSIADNKSVESLKLYWMYLAYKKENKWTKEMASEHCEEMCKILDDSFQNNDNSYEQQ